MRGYENVSRIHTETKSEHRKLICQQQLRILPNEEKKECERRSTLTVMKPLIRIYSYKLILVSNQLMTENKKEQNDRCLRVSVNQLYQKIVCSLYALRTNICKCQMRACLEIDFFLLKMRFEEWMMPLTPKMQGLILMKTTIKSFRRTYKLTMIN